MTAYNKNTPKALTLLPPNDRLDLTDWIGQRQSTFRFDLINGNTGMRLGELKPIQDTAPVLTHDTSSTIKRQLSIALDHIDLAEINVITDRILPYMLIGDEEWPLGRYMWATDPVVVNTGGDEGAPTLTDEMGKIDQEITKGFMPAGSCDRAMIDAVHDIDLPDIRIDQSPYEAVGAYAIGSRRGQILENLASIGDLESPWLDNDGTLRSVRVVDPAEAIPAFNFDEGTPVYLENVLLQSDILEAPNRFIVIGNGRGQTLSPAVGQYDVPVSAPHSAFNRGFVIQRTETRQLLTSAQATAAARSLGLRSQPHEEMSVVTPPDPRHDSYDVIRFRGSNWLEIAWSMTMVEGGDMTHTIRKAYGA